MKTRVAVAVLAALIAVGGMAAYGALRIRHWSASGITGVNYFPVMPEQKRQPRVFGIEPGAVFMVYPGAHAAKAGMRARDAIVSINGIPVSDNKALEQLDARLRTGDIVTYRIRDARGTHDVSVPLGSPLRNALYVVTCGVSLMVALAFLAIGLVVFAKQPYDRRVVVFYAMLVVGAVYLTAAPALTLDASNMRGIYTASTEKNLIPFLTFTSAAIAFLPLTLHLALVFPRDRRVLQTSPRVLYWVYGIPAMAVAAIVTLLGITMLVSASKEAERQIELPLNIGTALLTLAGFGIALRIARRGRTEGMRNAFWHRPVQSLVFIVALFLGIGRIAAATNARWLGFTTGVLSSLVVVGALTAFPVLACIAMYRSYREAGAEERRQVKWPLWGTAIALGTRIVLGTLMQAAIFVKLAMQSDVANWLTVAQYVTVFSTLLYLLIPISFAFAILKYRLMNIDVIIRKTVSYAILSTAIILVYLALVGGLGTLLVRVAGLHNQTMVIASTLVVALLFVPLRNKLQTLVDRNLFRSRYDYPEALRAIAADSRVMSDAHALLASSADKLQHALQNRAIAVFTEKQGDFVATAKVGLPDDILGRLRVSGANDPALARLGTAHVTPIGTRGLIAAGAKLSGAALEEEDVEFLRSAAEELAAALDRIRLLAEEADYTQARTIQESLLPREMPRIEGLEVSGMWQPARTMGGDYYDLIKLSERELAICIGDVAGKGMAAALTMSGLQAAVRASASGSPRDLCERVRRVVVSSLSGGRFVTFFYATIDLAAMRLRWCNAGHNAPILARADGTILRLADGGPAISRLFRDTPYEERELALERGDRIVLFTDGVTEVTDARGDMFGDDRVAELVVAHREASAPELQKRILEAATAFGGGELEDDLTLLVVVLS
ncbi:MAG TPA: SpoIIE family protein phosphatase [Thermoanaerobaculia bacterium]|nr:SpoIIE family protein phosphatase [Thermoanaerobaculia bacterium]